jgi:thiosulfate/3-mercaptopyruvate sulfurtransferase
VPAKREGNFVANTVTFVVDTSQYTHPRVLVDSEWFAQHWNDSNVRSIEADEKVLLDETRHLPKAVKLDWHSDVPVSPDGAHPKWMWTLTAAGGLKP